MALDKAIASGKEHRKPYIYKNYNKSVDPYCRNHGKCPWCRENRLYKNEKRLQKLKYEGESYEYKNIKTN